MNNSSGKGPSFIRLILGIAGYSMFVAANFFFCLMIPFMIVLSPWPRFLRLCIGTAFRSYVYFLTRIYLPMLGVYRIVELSGFDVIRSTPSVLVSNHRSRIDGLMLPSILKNAGVVIKASYLRWPIFTSFVKYIDFISIDSGSVDSISAALTRCKNCIRRGIRVLIFPEGTRARSSKIGDFKDLAFRLAIDLGIPVIPIVIHSDYPFMTKIKGSYIPPIMMRFTVRALRPVVAEKDERPVEFASRVRRLIADEIKSLDKGTIWENL
jgi:1-acyl-sn-glycerol-3-phosphate acyltransferase